VTAPAALAHGVLLGSAGNGRISGASRADYAAAAAAVLTADTVESQVHELAGDDAFTLTEFAAALADVSGKPVAYRDVPEAEYRQALEAAGLPTAIAEMLAESDAKAAHGALYDDGGALSALIGRPTTPWRETVKKEVPG
jgi:NAD(P)H dehydrogenase (quinone)